MRRSNYFYYNCLTGRFLRDNCPSYLKEANFNQLKAGVIDRLSVVTGTFMGELTARKYTKVRAAAAASPFSPSLFDPPFFARGDSALARGAGLGGSRPLGLTAALELRLLLRCR